MKTFLKEWLMLSVALSALTYILILMVFGHDPETVTKILLVGPYWGYEAVLAPTDSPYPKFTELIFGPAIALWYTTCKDSISWDKRILTLLLAAVLAHFVIVSHIWIGLICFCYVGYLIGKKRLSQFMMPYINMICFGSFYFQWVLSPYSLGIVLWCYITIAVILGSIAGGILKGYRKN